MAGKWIAADVTFRSSISLDTFEIFLVDKKVKTLSSFKLEGVTYPQLMIWLEEQIGKLGLDASNLTINLPYEIPKHPVEDGETFQLKYARTAVELSKYFHNTYLALKKVKTRFDSDSEIRIWPKRFDLSLQIVLRDTGDPETNTQIVLGMNP